MENIYVTAMKNGKQVRVKYRNKCEDYSGGWWSEELWIYDPEANRFHCYYPDSNFEKGFFHTSRRRCGELHHDGNC